MSNNAQKPLIPNLNYRSGIDYATCKAIGYLKNGINRSKRYYKKLYKQSPYIHGIETLERYVGVFNNFKDTVLIPAGAKRIDKITAEHVTTHFGNLLDKNCSEKTINVNASALNKFFTALGRPDLVEFINENRAAWRTSSVPFSRTEPFTDPEKVIQATRGPYQAAAVIQYLTGARVSDIRKVYEWIINNPSSSDVFIRKSKGGRDRTIKFSDRPRSMELIRNAVTWLSRYFESDTPDWLKFMKDYTGEVKLAAKKCGEIYCGTHAFRVNYANDRYSSLSETTGGHRSADIEYPDEEREKKLLSVITEELGHSRISMAKYYIPAYRV